ACRQVGFAASERRLPATIGQSELIQVVADLSAASDVDGILVQMPLPRGLTPRAAIDAIDPAKDVDGFHPINVGRLWSGEPGFVPCTPLGIVELLERQRIPVEGAEAVVLGRSDIVGKPMAA